MDKSIKECFDNLGSTDDKIRMDALQTILKITEEKVDWVYQVWDDLFRKLDHENSYQRSIAIMVLCNLAKSDSENRLERSLKRLLDHTRDEKFVTTRQCIQNIWKVAAANSRTRQTIIDHLEKRYEDCVGENHYNLIRQDIIQSIQLLYVSEKDESLLARAREMIKNENDERYRKKYVAILKHE